MKKSVLWILIALALAACDSGLGSGGGAGGSAGGGNAAPAADPYVMQVVLYGAGAKAAARTVEAAVSGTPGLNPVFGATLDYTITISRPGESKTEHLQSGQGVLFSGLATGQWTLSATATLLGQEVVTGSSPVTIRAGETTTTVIPLDYDQDKLASYQEFGDLSASVIRLGADDPANALETWLASKIGTPGKYVAVVEGTQTLNPVTITASNVTLALRGSGTVSLASNGSMFLLNTGTSGNKLILRGPKLVGRSTNTVVLVGIISGEFVMHAGEISGNNNTFIAGGGVGVNGSSGAQFTMNGGSISGNTAPYGGGVVVNNGGRFTMNGGSISGNTATNNGGGVYVNSGSTFTMNGGNINGSNQAVNGAGVYVYDNGSQFTMSGSAVISGNTATTNGGGVYVTTTSGTVTFEMQGGTISGNRANNGSGGGGGVYVYNSGSNFTMSGGTISGNTATTYGGGVYANAGPFYKTGGSIMTNTASTGQQVYTTNGSKSRNADAGPDDDLTYNVGTNGTAPWI